MMNGDQGQQNYSSLCDEAVAIYGLVDRVTEGVVQLVNSSGEHRIACRRGCNTCCTAFVRVTHAEAAVIATWLLAPERAARLKLFRKQMAMWHEAVGPEVGLLEALATKHDTPPSLEPDSGLLAEAARTYRRRMLMCPFNADDGGCEIYTLRPVVCRAFYVAGTSENCAFGANGEVAVVRHAILTEIALIGRRVLRESSAAAGHCTLSALPVGVERAVMLLKGGPPQAIKEIRHSICGARWGINETALYCRMNGKEENP